MNGNWTVPEWWSCDRRVVVVRELRGAGAHAGLQLGGTFVAILVATACCLNRNGEVRAWCVNCKLSGMWTVGMVMGVLAGWY